MVSRYPVPFGSGRSLFGRSDPLFDLHREVNRLFDDVVRGTQGGPDGSGGSLMIVPAMDIHDRDDALEISAELPGVSQDNIDLRIEGDMLTIRGEKHNERKDEQARLVERSYGSFQRSIQLPFAPNANEVQASFTDGVLTVTLPKTAEKERSQRIEVRSGQSGGAGQRTIEGSLSSAQASSAGRSPEESGTGGGSGSAGGPSSAGAGQSGPADATGGSEGARTSA